MEEEQRYALNANHAAGKEVIIRFSPNCVRPQPQRMRLQYDGLDEGAGTIRLGTGGKSASTPQRSNSQSR
jgi:hypothetical protein